MTRLFSFITVIAAGLLFVSSSFAASNRNFVVHLTGNAVVPPVDSRAQGEARFKVSTDGNSLNYKLITANIDNVISAHLHAAPTGENGPVVVNLYPTAAFPLSSGRASGILAEGTITAADLVGPGTGFPVSALIDAMTGGEIYIDVHTSAFSQGEIRVQMGSGAVSGEPPCGSGPLFTVLPVNAALINVVGPLGGFNPPGHTVPSDHLGISTVMPDVALNSPGNLHLLDISRTQYIVSPFRQGQSDYGLRFAVCGGITGVIAHVTSLASSLSPLLTNGNCVSYSTGEEQVESCDYAADVHLSAGVELGTVGPHYIGAFDFGLYDLAHENFYINPARINSQQLHAVCPYNYFEATLQEYLLSRVGDGTRFRTDEPRCGTVVIDVPGTAQGLWVLESDPVVEGGDQSNFVSLALDPITPSTNQVLSVGSPTLGPRLMKVTTQHAGRVNRAFSEIAPSDLIYCYTANPPFVPFNYSYFVSLGLDGVLSVEKINHVGSVSPCSSSATTWAFSTNRVRFIR